MHKRTVNSLIGKGMKVNESKEGESIEAKIRRITNNKEPIKDGAPLNYTERKEGINPAYDIRTDRFEIAVEAMDKVSSSKRAKREGKPDIIKEDKSGEAKETTKDMGNEGKA